MPKYYCDYCDTYLTHDSPSVRKTHCAGRKHLDNVKIYYQQWADDRTQAAINAIIAAQKAGQFPPANTWPFAPPQNPMLPHVGFCPPPPNMYPNPMGFCPPNMMPPNGPNMHMAMPPPNMMPQRPYLGPHGPNMMYSGPPTTYPMPQMPMVGPSVIGGRPALPGPGNDTV